MANKSKCIGNCRLCDSIGQCPEDHVYCEDCNTELEPGEGIEIEVEAIERGKYYTRMITVCPTCNEKYYRDEHIEY